MGRYRDEAFDLGPGDQDPPAGDRPGLSRVCTGNLNLRQQLGEGYQAQNQGHDAYGAANNAFR
jgi:hypothetical protein